MVPGDSDYENISLLLETIKSRIGSSEIKKGESELENERVFVMDLGDGNQVEVSNFRNEVYTLSIDKTNNGESGSLFGMSSTDEAFRTYTGKLKEIYESLRSKYPLAIADKKAGKILEKIADSE